MTRGQRSTHGTVFRILAVFFVLAIGFALVRRHVVADTEAAPLGRAP